MLLSLLVRLMVQVHRMENRIMASQADLEAALNALIADQATFIADVAAEVAALQAASPTPIDFQPLIDKITTAKTALDAADASTKPATVATPAT